MLLLMLSRLRVLLPVFLLTCFAVLSSAQDQSWIDVYREPVSKILAEATKDDFAWQRLAYLTDTFGNRLAGSQALTDAIEWAAAEMARDGIDTVRKDPVKVPHWVRGAESLEVTAPHHLRLPVLGLGLSVGTPADGIEAEALVVDSFLTLEQRASEARGKIVVFNEPFKGYGPTVAYRVNGASQAAEAGALAVLVRSVGLDGLRTLHTGMLTYREGVPKIPAAAISGEDADRLTRMAARGERLRLKLTMGAEMLPDGVKALAPSGAAVVGQELKPDPVALGQSAR